MTSGSSREGLDLQRLAVGVDRDRPVLIGAEDLGADVAVALEHRRRRMAEGVAAADADDGDARRERAHELRRARRQAAVVRHLDDPQRRRAETAARSSRSTSLPMSPVSTIETSRHSSSSTIESSFRTSCRSQSATRMPHDNSHVVDRQPSRRSARSSIGAPPRRGVALQRAQRLERRHRNAFPDVARPELADDRRQRRRCDRRRRASARARRAAGRRRGAAPAPTTRSPMSNDEPPRRPPASTSIVAPAGN